VGSKVGPPRSYFPRPCLSRPLNVHCLLITLPHAPPTAFPNHALLLPRHHHPQSDGRQNFLSHPALPPNWRIMERFYVCMYVCIYIYFIYTHIYFNEQGKGGAVGSSRRWLSYSMFICVLVFSAPPPPFFPLLNRLSENKVLFNVITVQRKWMDLNTVLFPFLFVLKKRKHKK